MTTPGLFRTRYGDTEAYCPLCDKWFRVSDYLQSAFDTDAKRWVANIVTHYRHEHVGWDKQWSSGYFHRHLDYDKEKAKINNRAKRQVIRKAHTWMRVNGICFEDIQALQYNDDKTLAIARKFLPGRDTAAILAELPPMQPAEQGSLF